MSTAGTSPDIETPAAPPSPIGRIESDMFCDACLYNLHGLNVTRDERLQLAIVRCPECGKFHAAGIATGAGRVWLHRLARFLLIFWVGFILLSIAAAGFAFFLLYVVEFEVFLRRDFNQTFSYTIRPSDVTDFGSLTAYLIVRGIIGGLALLAGASLGGLLSVFLWHVRNRAWFLLAMLLSAAIGFCMYHAYLADIASRVNNDAWRFVAAATVRQFALQSIAVVAGITFGRRIARLLLRILLTRKLLQYFRFLWEVDNLPPPALASPTEPLPPRT